MPDSTTTADFLASVAMDPDDYNAGYVQPGWLEGTTANDQYVSWQGKMTICLDGQFSADELRAILAHMEDANDSR